MKNEPLVSVVITNYNGENYIEAAIESVLNQTWKNWELIIVDDASTDRSLDRIRRYADDRIRLLVNSENLRVSAARNRGWNAAGGAYIATLDGDDVWKPEKLEKQVDYLESHPETGACFTWLTLIDGKGAPVRDEFLENVFRAENRTREAWIHDLLINGNCLADDSSLIRRETLRRIRGSNPALVQLQDLDRWVRIALQEPLYVLQEPLLMYRRVSDGSSVSAPGKETFHRHHLEYAWMVGHVIREMEDDLFLRAFRQELRDPESRTPEEVRCEKAFLLCSDRFPGNGIRLYGFEMMEHLMREEKTERLLKDRYGFDIHQLMAMTGQPILYDLTCQAEVQDLKNRETELQNRLRLMENSRWWRIRSMIRGGRKA